MKITPLDIQHQQFRKSLLGLDPRQVHDFLQLVRREWEDLYKKLHDKQEEVDQLEYLLEDFRQKETTLKQTMVAAQRVSEDIKGNAQKEAEIIVSQAEMQADKILGQAHERLTKVISEINEVKRQRAEFQGRLRGLIDTHFRMLELEEEEREERNLEDIGLLPKAI